MISLDVSKSKPKHSALQRDQADQTDMKGNCQKKTQPDRERLTRKLFSEVRTRMVIAMIAIPKLSLYELCVTSLVLSCDA